MVSQMCSRKQEGPCSWSRESRGRVGGDEVGKVMEREEQII